MMLKLFEKQISCPYCWEVFSVLIEPSLEVGECYIEDCYVCCRPIELCIQHKEAESIELRVNRIEGNEF